MHFCKLFANAIHKDPPFRNPYVYLKEEEFIKLQKQKEQSESKLLKERKETEDLMDNQIISALNNLSSAVASKRLSDTRKKLIKKKEDLIEIIFPIESNISSEGSSKEMHSNERNTQSSKENRGLFRFFTSHITKSTISSRFTSLSTTNSNGSDSTNTTTTTYNPEATNKCDAIDTSNTSICSSVVALKSKDSIIPSSDAVANLEHPSSCGYSTTSYCISYTEHNTGNVLTDEIYSVDGSSSMCSFKTLSLPLSLTAFPTGQDIITNSNMHYKSNPFVKTIFMDDTILNCSKNNYSIESGSTGSLILDSPNRSRNYDFPASNKAFFPNTKAAKFYNIDGSIVLPKANYTNCQLNSFRRRYHKYSMASNSLRLDSLCSNKSDIEPRQFDYCTEELENEMQTCGLISSGRKNIKYLNDSDYLNDIDSNYIHKHTEEFESSSVYDSESDKYFGQHHLTL
ncbi:unnamed protein product [Debaryomyces tyrocola]|nr:unnamed protein product [Debaryomyces tyrocola]